MFQSKRCANIKNQNDLSCRKNSLNQLIPGVLTEMLSENSFILGDILENKDNESDPYGCSPTKAVIN